MLDLDSANTKVAQVSLNPSPLLLRKLNQIIPMHRWFGIIEVRGDEYAEDDHQYHYPHTSQTVALKCQILIISPSSFPRSSSPDGPLIWNHRHQGTTLLNREWQ